MGVEVTPVTLKTNYGPITFVIWDTAGQERFGGLRDGYYINGQAALLFYDIKSSSTFQYTYTFRRDIYRVCGTVPTVYCANKMETVDDETIESETNRNVKGDVPIIPISSKSGANVFEPLLKLAEQCLNVNDITLVDEPSL